MLLLVILIIVVAFCIMAWVGAGAQHAYSGGHRSKSEAAIIAALEHITRIPFPQAKPTWLRECGKQLELDGYNSDAKIALEFSGPLHTKWHPGVETREKFLQRVGRDAYKKALCKQMGVSLIVVDASLPRDKVYDYLRSRLSDHDETKYPVPQNYLPLREPIYILDA